MFPKNKNILLYNSTVNKLGIKIDIILWYIVYWPYSNCAICLNECPLQQKEKIVGFFLFVHLFRIQSWVTSYILLSYLFSHTGFIFYIVIIYHLHCFISFKNVSVNFTWRMNTLPCKNLQIKDKNPVGDQSQSHFPPSSIGHHCYLLYSLSNLFLCIKYVWALLRNILFWCSSFFV